MHYKRFKPWLQFLLPSPSKTEGKSSSTRLDFDMGQGKLLPCKGPFTQADEWVNERLLCINRECDADNVCLWAEGFETGNRRNDCLLKPLPIIGKWKLSKQASINFLSRQSALCLCKIDPKWERLPSKLAIPEKQGLGTRTELSIQMFILYFL